MLTIVLQNSFNDAKELIEKTAKKTDCYEFRLDTFGNLDVEQLKGLFKLSSPIKTILTFRMSSQGGMFEGSFHKRWEILKPHLSLEPTYVDFEYNTPEEYLNELKQEFPNIKLILSYHDFEQTDPDLFSLTKRVLLSKNADAYKLATKANHINDALRMFTLVRSLSEDRLFTGICMGEKGALTRILAPVLGSTFNYVVGKKGLESAEGQLGIHELIKTYRYRSLNKGTKIFALLGNPVAQSPSHITHNKVFQKLEENAVYIKIKLEKEEFSSFVNLAKDLPFYGFSVTVPFKEIAGADCKTLDDYGKKIGAVNTLYKRKGEFHGTNTDGIGALRALEHYIKLKGKTVVVLGAGGSARAITYALQKCGAKIVIINRTASKAHNLAKEFGCDGFGVDEFSHDTVESPDVIINTTTVGMNDVASTPLRGECISKKALVMDIVTSPKETKLLKLAQEKGCTVMYGYEMFVYQAIEQFILFIDQKLDRQMLEKSIKDAYFLL
ncbi:shikimate dehydrogenase [Candidatus Aerophobetes bacterium]|uniref:Multifunctional fusion protein n=1 Tax=Aerophobetes bacterium TaxID=2030807 RepID=A0A2A4YKM0_UNCAE|nr:MAG: shikimate dehydrogenase [Candidatus Aerophobetes bacterium]